MHLLLLLLLLAMPKQLSVAATCHGSVRLQGRAVALVGASDCRMFLMPSTSQIYQQHCAGKPLAIPPPEGRTHHQFEPCSMAAAAAAAAFDAAAAKTAASVLLLSILPSVCCCCCLHMWCCWWYFWRCCMHCCWTSLPGNPLFPAQLLLLATHPAMFDFAVVGLNPSLAAAAAGQVEHTDEQPERHLQAAGPAVAASAERCQ
jgi:hypothetical protein